MQTSLNIIDFASERQKRAGTRPEKSAQNESTSEATQILDMVAAFNKRKLMTEDAYYQAIINRMNKWELLEEMSNFQTKLPSKGSLSLTRLVRARILFTALEASAETEMLRTLAKSQRREYEHKIDLIVREKLSRNQ
jgi:hypothetical protein